MGEISIKVNIANRTYPLKISFEEEEAVRKAAKIINDKVKSFEENFSVRDKQDLLAMCALQFATELSKKSTSTVVEDSTIESLENLDSLLAEYLEKK